MSFFVTKKDHEAALSKIGLLESETTELQASLAEAQNLNAQNSQTIADLQASLAAVTAERDNATATVAQRDEAITAQSEQSAAELEVAQKAIAEAEQCATNKATALLAEAGHPPINFEVSKENNLSASQLREIIAAIPDAKARLEATLKNWDKLNK
jgi:septal ring factor EnvC (AmiA/AmiB activator)